jgi:hypothetical protein
MEQHLDRSFRSLMDAAGPPEGDNPFFREVMLLSLSIVLGFERGAEKSDIFHWNLADV